MYQEYPYFIREGWFCPRCKIILNPSTNFCPYCGTKEKTFTTTSTSTKPEWIYKEDTTTGSCPSYAKYGSITVDDILRRDYYDDEDLWGKPL